MIDCGVIPQVRDSNGDLFDSQLFVDLLHNTGDRDLSYKAYIATFTPIFQQWFEGSPYVDQFGQPKLFFDRKGNLVFVNRNKDVKIIKKKELPVTEDSIINDLIKQGVVNKNRIYGERVLPRPLQGSDMLESHYQEKDKPETLASLEKIKEINQQYRERFGVQGNIISIRPFGKTYSVKINPTILKQISSETEVFAPDRHFFPLPFAGLRMFKENLIANLNDRLIELSIKRKRVTSAQDIVEITKNQHIIEERISKLKRELDDIDAATTISNVDAIVRNDLARMEKLAQSSDYRDQEEAYEISKFYEHSDPDAFSDNHNIFTEEELFDQNKVSRFSPSDVDTMQQWAAEARKVKNYITSSRKDSFVETINNDESFKRTFRGQRMTFDELVHSAEGLKDATLFDMYIMDTTNGVFSHNGILPQMMKIALENAQNRADSFIKEKEEQMKGIVDKAEKVIGELYGGKYKLRLLSDKTLKKRMVSAVSWDLFFQRDIDGTKTGNIVKRYSRVWDDAQSSMRNRIKELEESGRIGESKEFKRKFFKQNAVILDITKIPELVNFVNDPNNNLGFLAPYMNTNSTHSLNITGNHLSEIITEQIELLKKLRYNYEARVQQEIESENVADYNQLSIAGKAKIERWLLQNSPTHAFETVIGKGNFAIVDYVDSKGVTKKMRMYNTFDYVVKIPRHNRLTMRDTVDKSPSGVTRYYDDNFAIVDQHSELYDFHKIAVELLAYQKSVMPADLQRSMADGAIGLTDQVVSDILFDPNRGWFDKNKSAAKKIYRDYWKEANWVKRESRIYKGKIDIIDNTKVKEINSQLVQGSRTEIDKSFAIEKGKFISAFNSTLTSNRLKDITRFTRKSELLLNQASINVLADYLEVNPTLADIKKKLSIVNDTDLNGNPIPTTIPIGRIIHNYVTNKVVETTTTNLPRSLMLFSSLAADYAAKTEAKPFIDAAMQFYKEIKKQGVQNTGESQTSSRAKKGLNSGERTRAIGQAESWYERAVLGRYEKVHSGVEKKIHYTEEELKQKQDIEDQLSKLGATPEEQARAQELQDILTNMGYVKVATKRIENLLVYIRFLGLGWNLNSALTNFLEGQICNEIAMSSGMYFPAENFYRATRIVRLSRRKALGKAISKHVPVHPMANMISILMNRYNILQDSRNEFQKAGIKTSFTVLEKLDPMMLNQSVEYLNQSPILVTALMTEKIKDSNGNESSVFDAMDMKTGKLKPEFRSEENINNWEKMTGPEYGAFKTSINKCIVDTHGDYDRLRGNLAKQGIVGKALLMFKGWFGRAFYMRVGVEQMDIETGRLHRGRYRSHTSTTATMQGLAVGLSLTTPVGLGLAGGAIGAAIGFTIAKVYGSKQSDLSYLNELVLTTKQIGKRMIGIPINRMLSREVIHQTTIKDLEKLGLTTSDPNKKFDDIDRQNFLSNMTEIAITLGWLGLVLLTKVFFYDDEDDEKDTRRQIHNLLANRCITMSQNMIMYLNPTAVWNDQVATIPVLSKLNDIQKLIKDIDLAIGGDNVDNNPAARGENRLWNQFKKTALPAPIKGKLGFEQQMQKQFFPTAYDKYFQSQYTKKKKDIEQARSKEKKKLINKELYTEDEIKYIMDHKFPTLDAQIKAGEAIFKLSEEELQQLTKDKIRRLRKEKKEKNERAIEIIKKRKAQREENQ